MLKDKKVKLLLIAFVSIIVLVVIVTLFLKNNNNNPTNNIENSGNNNQNVEKIRNFSISNLEVDLTDVNVVKLFFKLENITSKDMSNKVLRINFYDNDNKLLFTYDYLIENLQSKENIYVQGTMEFLYQNIKKYEFVIDDSKVVVNPDIIK